MTKRAKGLRVFAALSPLVLAHGASLVLWTAFYPDKLAASAKSDSGFGGYKGPQLTPEDVKRYLPATPSAAKRDMVTLGALALACLLGFVRPRTGLIVGFGAGVGITAAFFIVQPLQLSMFCFLIHPLVFWVTGYGFGVYLFLGAWRHEA